MNDQRPASLGLFPLIGRDQEVARLTRALEDAERGSPSTIFLAGEGGIGKTRLAEFLVDAATRRNWSTAVGRAYPVETGVPYALFSDALLPRLKAMDPGTLAVMSRGGEAELARLFPALDLRTDSRAPRGDVSDLKARLLWNFSQFLGRFAAKRPLLIVLENVHWADASSLELLHFVARQLPGQRIVVLCSYSDAVRDSNPALGSTERSLTSLGAASVVRLSPWLRADSDELVARLFDVDPSTIRDFAALLYERTRGNPFFTEETLKSLVDSGQLRREDDRWVGWDLTDFRLPSTVRDAIVARLERLSPASRTVVDIAAVLATRASYEALEAVSGFASSSLVEAIDELRRDRVLVDADAADGVHYDFTHPSLQAVLYAELGKARARLLHGQIATALEQMHGAAAEAHADELAFHFSRASSIELAPKAARYLYAAGRSALARYATREAASYLGAALDLVDGGGPVITGNGKPDDVAALVEDVARAKQRNGEYGAARALWERALGYARQRGDSARISFIERRLGNVSFWAGHHDEAFDHYAAGLEAARLTGDERLAARIRIAQAAAFQELGRPGHALRELGEALSIAERLKSAGMLARIHRALMNISTAIRPSMPNVAAMPFATSSARRTLPGATEAGRIDQSRIPCSW